MLIPRPHFSLILSPVRPAAIFVIKRVKSPLDQPFSYPKKKVKPSISPSWDTDKVKKVLVTSVRLINRESREVSNGDYTVSLQYTAYDEV